MKNIRIYQVALCLSCLMLAGCGYFYSGTWEDDPDNWERAYGYEKPDEIEVVHSWYWRSPHWSLEYELYIQTTLSKDILRSFLSKGDLEQMKYTTDRNIATLISSDTRPVWFVPKMLDEYEVWVSCNPDDEFKLFIDRKTGHLYWYEIQL